MSHFQRFLASLLLLCAHLMIPTAASAFENHVAASLISETDRLSSGKSTRIALKLSPQSGWHVYWSNPGDSGMPPRINWTLPPKVRVGELRHPAPHIMDAAGFISYVHEGEVALLADLHIPPSLPTGTPITLVANVQWLSCSDSMCVPEKARLTLDLAVGTGTGGRSSAKDFDTFEQAMPRLLTSPGIMRVVAEGIEFEFANSVINPANARLFPENQSFDASAPQQARRDGGKIIFTIKSQKPLPAHFEGVITASGAARGFAVSARRDKAHAEPQEALPTDKVADPAANLTSSVEPVALDIIEGADPVPTTARPGLTDNLVAGPAMPATSSGANFLPAFFGALIGGLLLNLMPCVFPILSLKALSLVRSGASEHAARLEAFSYTAGAIIACTALGAGLIALRAAGSEIGWAFQLQNPYVILAMAALMAAISFNLLGLFELPSFSMGGGLMMREGSGGAFWTGALTAVIATPCSGPFMGLAIGAALVLPAPAALAVFFGLGFGLALPFLAIGTIPALRRMLPKPGAWMARLRQILAIPMLLTTAALIWILGRQTGATGLIIGSAAFIASGAALAWAGKRQQAQSGVLAPLGALGLLLSLSAALLPSPQAIARVDVTEFKKPFSEATLADLRAKGTPVFVDFTADWCLSCKVNEKVAINTDKTQAALQTAGVVTLIGDWTNSDPEISRFLAKHGRNSIPFYLYYAPGQEPIVLPQILGPDALIEIIGE